jgi:pyruvate-ferredoxin/flavodoxin oxidoreductase
MMGVAARRHHFIEPILEFLEQAYEDFARLTGRRYGLITEYNNDHNETTIVALGSAAENCDAAVDYIKETRGEDVGVLHVNVLRPFPEKAIVKALAGKKRVIVLERMDDQTAGDGPLARDIRTALLKAREHERYNAHHELPKLDTADLPRMFSGVYGLGSRDFRPEAILGAYEFATGKIARQDGRHQNEGASFFYLGIDHPYAVESDSKPSLLPEGAIAVRFHSIGGWGMITTGKNLGGILGVLGNYIARRDHADDPAFEALHVSANPKYGSEKKGAPTNYFMVVAPERIRVNCDLRHVSVVLCCDPKAFTHDNPLVGLEPGGAFVWESSEENPKDVWERIPRRYRQQIIDKNIRIFTLQGFTIAREATDRQDLQFRMQGNAFLGAFFKVSTFLQDNDIPEEEYLSTVHAQYQKKFGRFGDAVVESNMTVMQKGFETVREVPQGALDAPDRSSMRGETIVPLSVRGAEVHWTTNQEPASNGAGANARPALMSLSAYDSEFRSDYGYDQPSSPHASTGAIAAATGRSSSKYVARRQTPLFIAENCTQCMACIVACPDSAMPNTAQKVGTVLRSAITNYVSNAEARNQLLGDLADLEKSIRAVMSEHAGKKDHDAPGFSRIACEELDRLVGGNGWYAQNAELATTAAVEFKRAIEQAPLAFARTNAIFRNKEKKSPGSGGVFGIFINDLCKGCGECVVECGDHEALVMVDETEEINGHHESGIAFLDTLPNTPTDRVSYGLLRR